jgi:hypothetical protein
VKELREGQSVKWNGVLFFSDSLEAAKMIVGGAVKKVTVAEPPVKNVAEPPARKKTASNEARPF